jgi:glucose 1-dehydrogenase
MRFEGKVALVTGAGSGIGRAIAHALAGEGARVVANDLDAVRAEETARLATGICVAAAADIGSLGAHAELLDRAKREFGKLDILVNNAGIQFRASFLESTPESWDRTVAVNLKGPFFLAQGAAKWMASTGLKGTILNVASIHDSVALRDRSIYAVTKGGLRMMTSALAFELADYGITVNAVSPGAILTDMNRDVLSNPAHQENVLRKIPLGRIGNTGDVSGAALFLVSSEASYITGATLYVDGGILVQ